MIYRAQIQAVGLGIAITPGRFLVPGNGLPDATLAEVLSYLVEDLCGLT
jgi:hypothetical protein